MPTDTATRPLVVAGDVSIDWLAWPLPALREAGSGTANWRQREGTRMVARRGGALLLVDLLRPATTHPVIGPLIDSIELKSPDEHLHSLVDLEPKSHKEGETPSFRVSRLRGFCGPEGCNPPQPALDGSAEGAALLVLDDSGNGFRDTASAWQTLLADARPDWLIVKMARPLAAGPMWEAVRHGPLGADGEPDPEHLIVVLNADDLRAEGIALSRRLSWERTAEEFVRDLAANGQLDTLVTCAHLIVRFDCDGVIHHCGRSAEPPVLYFDPAHAEGEFVDAQGGRMIGTTAAFTAALAAALAEDPVDGLDAGIRSGMTASRRLATAGFHEDTKHAPDYPHAHVVTGAPDPDIVALRIPSKRIAAGESWSILHDTLGDPGNAARRVVTEGPAAALARVPLARFAKLRTADRREIESFRAIGNLLREYLSAPRTKPISIGVFGPPGAGKSFGVTQVATQVAQDRTLALLEFNLSQFTSLADLVAAFHLVRDSALSGAMPLVFFDEFDSNFGCETRLAALFSRAYAGREISRGGPRASPRRSDLRLRRWYATKFCGLCRADEPAGGRPGAAGLRRGQGAGLREPAARPCGHPGAGPGGQGRSHVSDPPRLPAAFAFRARRTAADVGDATEHRRRRAECTADRARLSPWRAVDGGGAGDELAKRPHSVRTRRPAAG